MARLDVYHAGLDHSIQWKELLRACCVVTELSPIRLEGRLAAIVLPRIVWTESLSQHFLLHAIFIFIWRFVDYFPKFFLGLFDKIHCDLQINLMSVYYWRGNAQGLSHRLAKRTWSGRLKNRMNDTQVDNALAAVFIWYKIRNIFSSIQIISLRAGVDMRFICIRRHVLPSASFWSCLLHLQQVQKNFWLLGA